MIEPSSLREWAERLEEYFALINTHRIKFISIDENQKKLLLIDTHARLFIARIMRSLDLQVRKGSRLALWSPYFLFKAIKDISPDYIVACFDLPGPTFTR